jgi:SnoaL-like domain
MGQRDTRIEELLAKQDIVELSMRYMRGLDRLDRELQISVFHDDAITDYGFFKGGAAEFVDFAQRVLKDHLANHHMLGQALIEIDETDRLRAYGEVYFHAFHRTVEHGVETDFIVAGRYVDRYECRNGVWKIAYRSEVNDWVRSSPAADEWLRNSADAIRGQRGRADPSYRRPMQGVGSGAPAD